MNPKRVTKRRATIRYSTSSNSIKRLKNDNVEIEATDKFVPGDLDFYIDDDGNMQTLEIGNIPNVPTAVESPVWVASPLAVCSFIYFVYRFIISNIVS